MADDKKQRGPADRSRVNLKEDYEVKYWTKAFDVSKSELAKAVKTVGSSAQRVKAHLKSRS